MLTRLSIDLVFCRPHLIILSCNPNYSVDDDDNRDDDSNDDDGVGGDLFKFYV